MTTIYEEISKNPHSRFIIGKQGYSVTGMLIGDGINLGANVSYNNPLESSLTQAISDIYNKFGAAAASFLGKNMGIYSLKHFVHTIKTWTSTEISPLTLEVKLVATKEGEDITEVIEKIYSQVMPTFKKVGNKRSLFSVMKAPGGVGFTKSNNGTLSLGGTLTLSLGNWFRAPGLVIDNANLLVSYTVTQDGKPLYAQGSITFSPFRAISYSEFKNYFKRGLVTEDTSDAIESNIGFA